MMMMMNLFSLSTKCTKDDDAIQPVTSTTTTTCLSSRKDFIITTPVAIILATTTSIVISTTQPLPALARGRATLEQAYDRYVPRIIAGGEFYARDLRLLIEKNDWAGLAQATNDPPPKSKEDRSKPDGGVADRLAQAGQFSEARVIAACDLFAAAFSDNSLSSKTKKMRAQVEVLKEVVAGMNLAAREVLGETGGSSGGGLFGLGGGKKASPTELAKQVRALYVKGGNAWNQYIFAANDGLAVQYKKLPYLK